MRREGTRNYYYLDPKNGQWETLLSLMLHIHGAAEAAQGRHCDKGEEV